MDLFDWVIDMMERGYDCMQSKYVNFTLGFIVYLTLLVGGGLLLPYTVFVFYTPLIVLVFGYWSIMSRYDKDIDEEVLRQELTIIGVTILALTIVHIFIFMLKLVL